MNSVFNFSTKKPTKEELTEKLADLGKSARAIRTNITQLANNMGKMDTADLAKTQNQIKMAIDKIKAETLETFKKFKDIEEDIDWSKYDPLSSSDYQDKWDRIVAKLLETEHGITNMWQGDISHRGDKMPTNSANISNPANGGGIRPTAPTTTTLEEMLPGQWLYEPIYKFDTNRYKMIPVFSGKYMEFLDFWDIFVDVVDKATNLSDSAKFHYLKQRLDPSTKIRVEGFPTSAYKEAKADLLTYFLNPNFLKQNILAYYRKLERVDNPRNIIGLRKLISETTAAWEKLKRADIDDHSLEQFTIIARGKFPQTVINSLMMMGLPATLPDIIKAAKLVLNSNENTFLEEMLNEPQQEERKCFLVERPERFQRRPQPPRSCEALRCTFCRGAHETSNCKDRKIPLQQKVRIAMQEGLCFRCMKHGHIKRMCPGKLYCSYGRPHAPSVCDCKPSNNMFGRNFPREQYGYMKYQQQKWYPDYQNASNQSRYPKTNQYGQNHPRIMPKVETVRMIQQEPEIELEQEIEHGTVHQLDTNSNKQPMIWGNVNKENTKILLDSGSTINLMPRKFAEKIHAKINPAQKRVLVKTVSGKFVLEEECKVVVEVGVKKANIRFLIVNSGTDVVLLGLEAWSALNLSIVNGAVICQNLSIDKVKPWTMKKINNIFNGWNNRVQEVYHLESTEINQEELVKENQDDLNKLVQNYDDVFAKSSEDIGQIKSEEMKIDLTDERPINLRPYPCSTADNEKIEEQVQKLLKNNLIETSTSSYSFPVVLVDKKDDGKKTRLCVDYRKLNEVTKTEHFPIPRIVDIEQQLLDAKYFATLDIASGFHHVRVAEKDRYKTAFVTKFDQYQWIVMPFGLKNAPIVFQRIVWGILRKHQLNRFAHNYIDDIIIYSKSWKEHLEHIEKVLMALRTEGIKLKKSKCNFGQRKIRYHW